MPHTSEHHYHLAEHLPHVGLRKLKSLLDQEYATRVYTAPSLVL